MDKEYIPLLSAFLGGLFGIVGGLLAAQRQVHLEQIKWNKQFQLEKDKWRRNINDTFRSELRTCIRELATQTAEVIHSMCWLCWLAKFGADQLTQDRINLYDNEMHALLPQITGQHAMMASMDYRIYELFKPLITKLIQLDKNIGDATLSFKPGNSDSAKQLADLYVDYLDFEAEISKVVSEAVKPYSMENN